MIIVNEVDVLTTGVDEDAFVLIEDGSTFTNLASVTTVGVHADAVVMLGNGMEATNDGVIDVAGLGAAGIFIAGDNAKVINSATGSIVTRGAVSDNGTPADPLDDLFPDGIDVFGDGFGIRNDGSIITEGLQGSAIVAVGDGGNITNNGIASSLGGGDTFVIGAFGAGNSILATVTSVITAVGNSGIVLQGSGGSVTNRGTMNVSGDFVFGIQVFGAGVTASSAGNISLSGNNSAAMAAFDNAGLPDDGDPLLEESITNSAVIDTDGDYTFGMLAQGTNVEIDNRGDIITSGVYGIGIGHGVNFEGYNPSTGAIISSTGDITTTGAGAVGIVMIGDDSVVTVTGLVKCLGGLATGGPLGDLYGSALIAAGDDIVVNADGRLLAKNPGAVAVYLNVTDGIPGLAAEETLTATLINTKVIHGGSQGAAIVCGDGQETVANSYHIAGLVDLGGGDDTYEARFGGRLDGALVLGKGDDLIDVDLYGGTLKVRDFRTGEFSDDRIDLTAFGLTDFQQIIDACRQVGESVRIGLEGTRIFLADHVIADLHPADFII